MKHFTLKSAAAALALLVSQGMMATGFTNIYAHAEVSDTGAGEIYITSDDPEPTLEAERGEEVETQYTTGTDGDQEWTDESGTKHKVTIFWATVTVAPAAGYKCLGLVKELYDDIEDYTDDDFIRGMAANESGDDKKSQLIKWNDKDNHMIEALCNPEVGVKTNMNFMGELPQLTNSNNFQDADGVPAADQARNAARDMGFDTDPNVTFYALMVPDEGGDPNGIEGIKAEPVKVNVKSFDLSGRRVSKTQKGIIIVDGKKLLNK